MNILITGGSGFIGKKLVSAFESKGWNTGVLKRTDFQSTDAELGNKIQDADVIINLAGAPIIQRWTGKYKEEIYNSRILTSRRLVQAINQNSHKPGLLISASATGIYEEGGPFDEQNFTLSDGFLGKVCRDWENEVQQVNPVVRLAIFRLGVVLDSKHGALRKMLPFFRLGLGGKIGSGKQPFSWIHIDDLVAAFLFAVENQSITWVFNLTAPNPVTNADYTKALSRALRRPAFFPIPAIVLRLLFGEASMVLTGGQKVYPKAIQAEGFRFRYPEINEALLQLLGR